MPSAQGQVGVQQNASGSVPLQGFRQLPQGDMSVSELHPRYFEQGRYGNVYSAANQAAQAVSVGLATTYTGLMLYNPVGSGVMLVPTKLKFALSAAPAAISTLGLIAGFAANGGVTAQTTKLINQSSQIGNPSVGKGIALSAATIATPTWLFELLDGFTAAAFPAPTVPVDLEGIYQIMPGGFIAIGALSAITGLGSIAWEEVPITQ
jgi:hypothetical protein